MHVRPRSPSVDPEPGWPPHPQGPSPAKRRRLHEPAPHEPLAPPDMEAPAGPASDALTSVVFLAAGCAMQLQLEGVDLLLEPEPTSVLQVSLPGHTLILVPEGLHASVHLGQPEFSSASPQEASLLNMSQDHVFVLLQESFCELVLDSSYQEDACDEDADLGFLSPWMDPPAGQASGHLSSIIRMPSPWSQGRIPEPYPPVPSSDAERYFPRSIWNLESYLLGPFPSSPLQSLPPSPPPSPQEQRPSHPPHPPHSPRAPCKARRRLFCE
ncbi:proline-rich protein 23A3-like [Onychomys torridus]|uniref:proline-rich protein 23A3-like n=1 Tax=Onychomys torridus TaxID=38674 RepID=UPI00167F6B77|nr:proline-rich protein 23A3-like [Onychomys torridus]